MLLIQHINFQFIVQCKIPSTTLFLTLLFLTLRITFSEYMCIILWIHTELILWIIYNLWVCGHNRPMMCFLTTNYMNQLNYFPAYCRFRFKLPDPVLMMIDFLSLILSSFEVQYLAKYVLWRWQNYILC